MKKIILVTVAALSLSATTGLSASANSASGFNVSQHSGVTVYRGAPQHVNHQVVAAHRALDLQERQIDNQARQAAAQQRAQQNLAQQRLDLDRRIAFTNNEIFSTRRSGRFNNRRFVTGGFNNRGIGRGGFNNRFFGVRGISQNTRISGRFGPY